MLTRRFFMAAASIAGLTAALPLQALAAAKLSVEDAHEKAQKGEILLVDVRRRDEWKQSGIGASAKAISMHERGFLQKLAEATGQDKTKPVALICATGGRSSWLQGKLKAFGYTTIIDVAEGMYGSPHGPGWLKKKLPIRPYAQ